ncbi:MAG TPA: hypothetical protein VJL27_03320 [Patescibacteria group bacterium]|nr:hypothetical protein [Patescibacteria group bacterium]
MAELVEEKKATKPAKTVAVAVVIFVVLSAVLLVASFIIARQESLPGEATLITSTGSGASGQAAATVNNASDLKTIEVELNKADLDALDTELNQLDADSSAF